MTFWNVTAMKLKMTPLKPKLAAFAGLLILSVTVMLVVRVVFHMTTSVRVFDLAIPFDWFNLIIYPLFISLGATFGARRHRLVIEDSVDGTKIRAHILNHLPGSGLRIRKQNESGVELESNHGFNRFFNN